jgi:hypothetical protein
VIFVPVSCKHVDNSNFHSGLTSSRSHLNGPRKFYTYRMSKKCPHYVLWYYYVGIDVSYRFLLRMKLESGLNLILIISYTYGLRYFKKPCIYLCSKKINSKKIIVSSQFVLQNNQEDLPWSTSKRFSSFSQAAWVIVIQLHLWRGMHVNVHASKLINRSI